MPDEKRSRNVAEIQQVIVVLGTTVRADGGAGPRLIRRVERAVAEFRAADDPILVLTGGAPGGGPIEAQVMRDQALAAGVPPERTLLEPEARNTLENALFTACLLPTDQRALRITLVTDWLHLPRARLTFWSIGLAVRPVAAAWSPAESSLSRWLGGLCYEVAALLWYGLRITAGVHRRAARRPRARPCG